MTPRKSDKDGKASGSKKQTVPVDEFQAEWKQMVQRVRVHELLKCLSSQHARLKVLRGHTEMDDKIRAKEDKADANTRRSVKEGDYDNVLRDSITTGMSFDSFTKFVEDESKVQTEKPGGAAEILTAANDTLFVHTQEEEEETIKQIYPPLKKVLTDPKYVAKCVLRLFRSRTDITEEDFEAIIELCDDKLEQQALREAYYEHRSRAKYLNNADERRRMLYEFINSNFFVQFMLVIIIISIIGIFLLTFERIFIRYAYPLISLDNCIIGIFLVEATLKISIYQEDYFKKPWNLLDILIIFVHFFEVIVELVTKIFALSTDINANLYFKVLKSLRALRLLRIIKFLPNLQVIVTTVFQSMLSMGSIAVLMSLFIFVFAVMGRGLFAEDAPNNFGELWLAFVTLFQLLTLDDWYQLLQGLQGQSSKSQYWLLFMYLFSYIVIENFVFLNLFVAVLVDNFQLTLAATEIKKTQEALIYLDETENDEFEEVDKNLWEDEEPDSDMPTGSYHIPKQPEMTVPDYFPVGEESREKVVLEHVFKDMCSIDFKRFVWRRRLNILHTILDKAITAHRNSWRVQDNQHRTELAPNANVFTT